MQSDFSWKTIININQSSHFFNWNIIYMPYKFDQQTS